MLHKEKITTEDGFWIMCYFLKEHYDLSKGEFELSDILSACEPLDWNGSGIKKPVDSGMTDFWNEAVEKYKQQGIPDWKKLKK